MNAEVRPSQPAGTVHIATVSVIDKVLDAASDTFITVARALDVDPLKLMTILLSGGKGKSPRAKPGAKRDS